MNQTTIAAIFFLILLSAMLMTAPEPTCGGVRHASYTPVPRTLERFTESPLVEKVAEKPRNKKVAGNKTTSEAPPPEPEPEPEDDPFAMQDDDTIFISVASYRDASCPKTIDSIYSNAARPDLVFIGLCQQNDPKKDADCALNDKIDEQWRTHIRTIRVAHFDAMGPTWARYLCSTLLQDEKYYLQIDSHCFFSKDWDAKLVRMIKQLKAKGVQKPMLSHYTKAHESYDDPNDEKDKVPTICKSFFNEDKMISFEGADFVTVQPGDLPRPNPYVAAGMMFGPSEFAREVPFDPNLPYLFVGEEILHSVRLWTHGWDIFTPSENVIYHFYTREKEPKFWDDVKYNNDKDAVNKVRNLLDLEDAKEMSPLMAKNLEVYGLGKQRSLQQYFEFAGIEKAAHKVKTNFCKDDDIFERWQKYRVEEKKPKRK